MPAAGRHAARTWTPAVRALLVACALPAGDLDAALLAHFIVAADDGRIDGSIGLQPRGHDALLRSFAVTPERRGSGLAPCLHAAALAQAALLGVDRLWLLTTTATGWFARHGWQPGSRNDVPAALQATPGFTHLCPASATCMTRRVDGATP